MKSQLSLLLLGLCLSLALAEKSSKLRRSSYFNEPAMARSNEPALEQNIEQDQKLSGAAAAGGAAVGGASSTGNKDASSGRLFLKKFLMFKNMFSSNNQPVIPIIITGGGSGTGTTSSPISVTSTGSIPTATGTITTSPITSPTTTGTGTSRQYDGNQDDDQTNGDEAEEQMQPAAAVAMAANAELIDEQALQAALAAGAQEYEVFTDNEQGGATESKATQNNRINLRRKGGRRGQGQTISVRIPPRYRRYFKNGQKVMLNTKNGPNKRRVVRKRFQNKNKNNNRFNNRRRGGNKNKKNKNKRPRMPVV